MMQRPTIFFAVYINVSGKSPQRRSEIIHTMRANLDREDPLRPREYEERYLVMPITEGDGRIELLYPTPFLTEEQALKLYDKYHAKYEELINKINEI